MRKILVAVGAYSEAIRMAPLVHRLRSMPSMQTTIYITAPHHRIFIEAFGIFGLKPEEELEQTQQEPSTDVSQGIDRVIEKYKPDYVLVLGDTATAIESSHLRFPANYAEAELHMYELSYHNPAEMNCEAIELAATYYFVPSEASRDNLIREGVATEKIYLIDSIAVDALLMAVECIRNDDDLKTRLASTFPFLDPNRRLIFVTGHRHENDEERLESLCHALKHLAARSDVQVACTMHPDSKERGFMDKVFADYDNIILIPLPDYLHLVYLMQTAYLILTDMGDTLKEALSLSKPVLVMRDETERPEAIDAGTIRLVGTDAERIMRECTLFLDDPYYYRAFSGHRNPYGGGQASQHIAETLLR